jgi:hypothetical protein
VQMGLIYVNDPASFFDVFDGCTRHSAPHLIISSRSPSQFWGRQRPPLGAPAPRDWARMNPHRGIREGRLKRTAVAKRNRRARAP